MNIQEALTEYQYKNVGQFRGIVQSLGYSEEYNKGNLRFTRGEDEFYISVDRIRQYTKIEPNHSVESASMERICKFFDRERALAPDYKEILSKEGVDIINWGSLNGDVKDRFTVIDHKNKICYTGKELYEYGLQNGYLLDGKGTQLEKGVLSSLTDVKGKPAKVRLNENGISIYYRKETLVIPDSILGKKLSKKQQQDLLDGNVIVLSSKKGDIFLQVDRDLNAVVVRSEKELSIPAKIGEYELTTADKYLLANGFSMNNKLLHGDKGYFIADVLMTADKKGYTFSNIQMIPETKAKELLQLREASKNKVSLDDSLKDIASDRDLDKELKEAVAKNDYEKMAQLKEEGYKPSEEVIRGLSNDSKIDEKQAVVIEKLFGIQPEVSLGKERAVSPTEQLPDNYIIKLDKPVLVGDLINTLEQSGIDVSYLNSSLPTETARSEKVDSFFVMVENGKATDWEPKINEKNYPIPIKPFSDFEIDRSNGMTFSERDLEFKVALESNDFGKLSQLKEEGYQPSRDVLQSFDSIPDNTMVAVRKIFGLKADIVPVLNDVKLVQSRPEKDIARPLSSTINRAFSDL